MPFVLPDKEIITGLISQARKEDVMAAMKAKRLEAHDLAALLSPAAEDLLGAMAERSARLTQQRFGRVIQLYAPIYLSNYCGNRCSYCGFSAGNIIDRRVLSLEEAEQEATILQKRGFSHLLLVAGEAPTKVGVEYLEALASRLRHRFASVAIEVQPMSTGDYRRLFMAGITSVAIYQETYDRQAYPKFHLAGAKSDMDYRLETPARGAEAGMREVGLGALLGLSDWRFEGVALGMHLAWMRKQYWRTALTVSFPRLRPAEGGFVPPVKVTERDLTQLLFALRIFDPDVGLVLSTREEERYRDGMLGLGPTRYSAGSCTTPGGYGSPELTGEQFSVGDHRSIEEVAKAISAKGFDPVRKDWDAMFQEHAA